MSTVVEVPFTIESTVKKECASIYFGINNYNNSDSIRILCEAIVEKIRDLEINVLAASDTPNRDTADCIINYVPILSEVMCKRSTKR